MTEGWIASAMMRPGIRLGHFPRKNKIGPSASRLRQWWIGHVDIIISNVLQFCYIDNPSHKSLSRQ